MLGAMVVPCDSLPGVAVGTFVKHSQSQSKEEGVPLKSFPMKTLIISTTVAVISVSAMLTVNCAQSFDSAEFKREQRARECISAIAAGREDSVTFCRGIY